jgi:polyisoprenyl-teichoic acid--peptidoglycan teichoic acid transferase
VRGRIAGALIGGLLVWVAAGAVAAGPQGRGQAPDSLDRELAADFTPSLSPDDLVFVLVIGSDARPGHPAAGSRADSLHVVGVNPRRGTAGVVGIPRDSYVPIPGVGTRKINEALFYGGPQLTVSTVERLTGIKIDAFVLAAFEEFRQVVSEVGGVEVDIPYAMSDAASGAHFRPGPTRLDGPEALAFSRDRHDVPGGDFGRSLNQGRFLVAALREFRSDVAGDPVQLFRWIAAGVRYLQSDLSFGEVIDLALAALSLDPGDVRNKVVSGSGGTAGGASVVRLGSSAQAIFRDLARDASF